MLIDHCGSEECDGCRRNQATEQMRRGQLVRAQERAEEAEAKWQAVQIELATLRAERAGMVAHVESLGCLPGGDFMGKVALASGVSLGGDVQFKSERDPYAKRFPQPDRERAKTKALVMAGLLSGGGHVKQPGLTDVLLFSAKTKVAQDALDSAAEWADEILKRSGL